MGMQMLIKPIFIDLQTIKWAKKLCFYLKVKTPTFFFLSPIHFNEYIFFLKNG